MIIRIFKFLLLALIGAPLPAFAKPTARVIEASFHCPIPLNTNGTTVISFHITNVCPAPLRINTVLKGLEYLDIGIPKPPSPEDGPERHYGIDFANERNFYAKPELSRWSSYNPNIRKHYRYHWLLREGLELFPGEGYMRRICFRPGWQNNPNPVRYFIYDDRFDGSNPTDIIVPGRKNLAIAALDYNLKISKPQARLEAVRPGECILWGPYYECYPAKYQALCPFKYTLGETLAKATNEAYLTAEKAAAEDPGLFAELEMDLPVTPGRDLPVTYVIGVRGMGEKGCSKELWLEQKSVVPANALLILKKGAGADAVEIARFDGENLRILLDNQPRRKPVLLNTGEFLAYHRTLPASALKLKKHSTYTLELQAEANWAPCDERSQNRFPAYEISDARRKPVTPPPLDKLSRKPLRASLVFKTK